jgi:hypothetical protein
MNLARPTSARIANTDEATQSSFIRPRSFLERKSCDFSVSSNLECILANAISRIARRGAAAYHETSARGVRADQMTGSSTKASTQCATDHRATPPTPGAGCQVLVLGHTAGTWTSVSERGPDPDHHGGREYQGGESLSGEAGRPPRQRRPAVEFTTTSPAKGTCTAQILALVTRPAGATLAHIAEATDSQRHGLRGFMANAGPRSAKNGTGERVYRSA